MRAKLSERVEPVQNLREYFKDSVAGAMQKQGLAAGDDTAFYVVNLLTLFARSEALFDKTENGTELKPLAIVLAEAVDSPRPDIRNHALKRVGDVSLFVAGFWGDQMTHRLVDLDYYVQMGCSAYGALSENVRGSLRERAFSGVFAELAEKFQDFVDVLSDIANEARGSDVDILRSYEIWLKTRSKRAARQLRSAGVEPNLTLDHDARH